MVVAAHIPRKNNQWWAMKAVMNRGQVGTISLTTRQQFAVTDPGDTPQMRTNQAGVLPWLAPLTTIAISCLSLCKRSNKSEISFRWNVGACCDTPLQGETRRDCIYSFRCWFELLSQPRPMHSCRVALRLLFGSFRSHSSVRKKTNRLNFFSF
jgi:hypothetical protein